MDQVKEFRMMMRPIWEDAKARVAQDKRRAFEKGIKKGTERTLAESLLGIYQARFGAVPEPVAAAVAAVHDPATLHAWISLFATASDGEIAAALLAPEPRAKKRAPAAKRRARA